MKMNPTIYIMLELTVIKILVFLDQLINSSFKSIFPEFTIYEY